MRHDTPQTTIGPIYRVRVEADDQPPEGVDGRPLPESPEVYEETPCLREDGAPVSYHDYCLREGNPDRHVMCGIIVESSCPACGSWHEVASLWGIDLMDDDPGVAWIGRTDTADKLPGYLGERARDLENEAQAGERP